jgi:hypothetical protein
MFVTWLAYTFLRGVVTDPKSPFYLPQHSTSHINEHHKMGRKQSSNVQQRNEKQKIPICKAMIFPGVKLYTNSIQFNYNTDIKL